MNLQWPCFELSLSCLYYYKMKSILYLLSALVLFLNLASAQQFNPDKKKNYSKNPYWIKLMDDPSANYFEVIYSYEKYWENRELPVEEDLIIGQRKDEDKKNFVERLLNFREEKRERKNEELAFYCKKFRYWKIKTEPYVLDDGHIMSADERVKEWKNVKSKTQK